MGWGHWRQFFTQDSGNTYTTEVWQIHQTPRAFSFLGDGEMDEPESIASIAIAGRERLDNLIVVVTCNLQRLDGQFEVMS